MESVLVAGLTGITAYRIRMQGKEQRFRRPWGAAVWLCMAVQLLCLVPGKQFTVQTALPLHLCSFSGLMTPLLMTGQFPALHRFFTRLSVPGALLALLFPAPLEGAWPLIGRYSFLLLHGLLLFAPCIAPRPKGRAMPRRTFLICAALVTLSAGVDMLFACNYLFLRSFPFSVPLWDLLPMGGRVLLALLIGFIVSYLPSYQSRFRRDKP